MIAVLAAVASMQPTASVMARTGSKPDDTYYKATVPTKDLDPAALDVIRRFSKWPGSYPGARRALLRLGWQPDPKVDCLNGQTLGEDPLKTCRDDPGNEDCRMCRAMPEIDACSLGSIQYCSANFIHPGSQVVLQITAGGDMQGAPETNTALEGFTFVKKSSPDR